MKTNFKFQAKVWKWAGIGAWHFVDLDKKLSAKVREVARPYSAGFVRVEVKVGKSVWTTALFPHKRSGVYLLSIKKPIRKKEEIFEGDVVKVSIKLV